MSLAAVAFPLTAVLACVLSQGEAGGRFEGSFSCPAGDKVCTQGNAYLQKAHRVQKVSLALQDEMFTQPEDLQDSRARPEAVKFEEPNETQEPDELPSPTDGNVTGSSHGCCDSFSKWPNLDNWVTCGGCKALVRTRPYGNRCDRYCYSFGHVCVAAAEEVSEDCREKYTRRCDQPIPDTSDMLCTCHRRNAGSSCGAPAPAPPAPVPPPPPSGGGRVQVRGRQLLVDGKPIHLKGVAWNPVGKGKREPEFRRYVQRDAELMKRAGINVVRTYSHIQDISVLDILWQHGIYVITSVYTTARSDPNRVYSKVRAVMNHPAILMWSIGNEWNYNGMYAGLDTQGCIQRIREISRIVRSVDQGAHPIASIYGAAPPRYVIDSLNDDVDVWGANVYQNLDFGSLFDTYGRRTGKPLFLGEFGADAFNAISWKEDQEAQARATTVLAQLLVQRSSVRGGDCLGGFIFEWSDEWWKDRKGSRSRHDIGGVAPGGGPYPDATFNEEWWGLVDIDRNPRRAFFAYAEVAAPTA